MGIGRHTHPGAGRPVKHPGRHLQPTVRIGTAQTTAKNSASRSLDCRMNADPQTKPLMPSVQQFSKLGSVGVLKLCCTTRSVHIRASVISHPTSSWLKEQDQCPVRQRAGTLRCVGPPRPGPLLKRPVEDKCSKLGKPSQASHGPKKPGRPP